MRVSTNGHSSAANASLNVLLTSTGMVLTALEKKAPVTSLPFNLFVLRLSARRIDGSQAGGELSRAFDPRQFSSSKIGPVYATTQPKFRP